MVFTMGTGENLNWVVQVFGLVQRYVVLFDERLCCVWLSYAGMVYTTAKGKNELWRVW